jgi:cell division protein FtsB
MVGEPSLDGHTVWWQRLAPVLIVLVLVPVAIAFNARLATVRQMRQDEARLSQEVVAEQARQADLKLLQSYVASDAYVEHWARVEARMAKPGEVTVIPIAPAGAQLNAAPSIPASAPPTIVDEWWAVFFDDNLKTAASPRE